MIGLELRELVLPGLTEPLTVTVELDEVVALVLPEPVATTLADVVTGLTEPDSGEVLVDGREIPRSGTSPVALVPPDGGVLPHLTIRANIGYGRKVGEGLTERQLSGQVHAVAAQLSLLGMLDDYPHELTPGRRMLAGLARALLRAPVAVLLEDRAGQPSWAAQLTTRDPLGGTATLVVADRRNRTLGLADTVLVPA